MIYFKKDLFFIEIIWFIFISFLYLHRGFFIIVLDLRLTSLAECRETSCQCFLDVVNQFTSYKSKK